MDAAVWPPRWVDFFRVPAGPASSLLLLGAHLGVAVHYVGRTFACGGQGCRHCEAKAGIEWRAYFPSLLLKPKPEKSQPKILDLPESAFIHLHDVANFTALHLVIGREGKSNKSKITIDMPGTVFDVPPPAPFNIKRLLFHGRSNDYLEGGRHARVQPAGRFLRMALPRGRKTRRRHFEIREASMTLVVPAYLRSRRSGGFKLPPPRIRHVFCCADCGAPLERASCGWVCPKLHGKIVPDGVLLDRLRQAIAAAGYRRYTANGLIYKQLRVQFWVRRNYRFQKIGGAAPLKEDEPMKWLQRESALVCLAAGCGKSRRPGQIFCAPHWFRVPKELRDRIWSSWKAVCNGDKTMAEHRPLVQEAVQSLEGK